MNMATYARKVVFVIHKPEVGKRLLRGLNVALSSGFPTSQPPETAQPLTRV